MISKETSYFPTRPQKEMTCPHNKQGLCRTWGFSSRFLLTLLMMLCKSRHRHFMPSRNIFQSNQSKKEGSSSLLSREGSFDIACSCFNKSSLPGNLSISPSCFWTYFQVHNRCMLYSDRNSRTRDSLSLSLLLKHPV